MRTYELVPNDSRKSFYRKCRVHDYGNGHLLLQSYMTIVCHEVNGVFFRDAEFLINDWSATTGRHIAAFCGLGKKAFFELPTM